MSIEKQIFMKSSLLPFLPQSVVKAMQILLRLSKCLTLAFDFYYKR